MEAGIADHFWSLDELVGLLDAGTAPMSKFVVNRTNRVITL
jgi:hypothetical protein